MRRRAASWAVTVLLIAGAVYLNRPWAYVLCLLPSTALAWLELAEEKRNSARWKEAYEEGLGAPRVALWNLTTTDMAMDAVPSNDSKVLSPVEDLASACREMLDLHLPTARRSVHHSKGPSPEYLRRADVGRVVGLVLAHLTNAAPTTVSIGLLCDRQSGLVIRIESDSEALAMDDLLKKATKVAHQQGGQVVVLPSMVHGTAYVLIFPRKALLKEVQKSA